MSAKRSLTYIEIDVDFCAHAYGESPCAAAIGVTGERKCFNTFRTCQDRINFSNTPITLRFAESTEYLPGDIDCFPVIAPNGVAFTPQSIDPGISMGERASLTVNFEDFHDSDTVTDPYYAEREYDPFAQGTFWGKFRARNTSLKGRPLRWVNGYIGQSFDQMEVRHFIIESTSGPDVGGTFKIVAKDLLKMADGDRAQAPRKSTGILLSALSAGVTTFTAEPSGIGDLEYPASGSLSIGEEAMTFTRTGDVFTVVRGQYGTEDSDHDDGDLIQLMLVYDGENAAVIIEDLLVNYAEVDAGYVPIAEWRADIDLYIDRVYSARIGAPTAVKDLINELIEQVGLVMWWDDLENKIKLRSLRPVARTAETIDDDYIIAGTLRITEQSTKQVSQVWTYFSQINPLESLDRVSNYGSGTVSIDAQSEVDYGVPSIAKIFSRWIAQFGRSAALRLGAQKLSRYRDPPRKFAFEVDRFQRQPLLGRGYNISSWPLQDETGAQTTTPIVITSLHPKFDRFTVTAEEMLFTEQEDLGDVHLIVIDQNSLDVNLRDVHDNIYAPPTSATEVVCIIEAGVYIGSQVLGGVSLDVGDWPAGCSVTIVNSGYIYGRGGRGGMTLGYAPSEGVGQAGGLALYTRFAIAVENNGVIAGGGGGGGAARRDDRTDRNHLGGGGGAGYPPGAHGNNTFTDQYMIDRGWSPGTAATTTVGGQGGYTGEISLSGSDNDYRLKPGNGGNLASAGTQGRWHYDNESHSTVRNPMAGGAAGQAVDGNSYITWSGAGSIIGAQVN